jgi:hypothetical protein
MTIGFSSNSDIETPLGLNQRSRTTHNVTILVASAPNGALVDGSLITHRRGGDDSTADVNAFLYSTAAIQLAYYNDGDWYFYDYNDHDTLEFQAGMTILITTNGVSNGDVLTFSSPDGHFGTTTMYIN